MNGADDKSSLGFKETIKMHVCLHDLCLTLWDVNHVSHFLIVLYVDFTSVHQN